MHLRYLPHFINVSFLLLKLCEGCLNFGNGLVIVGCTVWKTFGEVEAWNVYGGGWGRGHHFGWRRTGWPWGWRGGCRCKNWRRCSRFLLRLDLLRRRERDNKRKNKDVLWCNNRLGQVVYLLYKASKKFSWIWMTFHKEDKLKTKLSWRYAWSKQRIWKNG